MTSATSKDGQRLVFKRDAETIANMRRIYRQLRERQREIDQRQDEARRRLWLRQCLPFVK